MADPEAATASQLRNIEQSTGRTVAQWSGIIAKAGLAKHAETVAFLKDEYGLTYGNANLLARKARELAEGGPTPEDALLDAQYSGGKAPLRPIYEAVAAAAAALGDDVSIVVQKTGVSLRRKKQFGVVQAPSSKRVDLGLNLGDAKTTERLQAATGMCSHRVVLTSPSDVDAEVIALLKDAYDRAG